MLEPSSDKISNVSKLKTVFEEIKNGKHKAILSVMLIIIIISIISLIFVSSNQGFYKKTIAKITILPGYSTGWHKHKYLSLVL